MLDGGSLAFHSSQDVGRQSLVVSHHKRSHHGCFGRPCAQGSVISAFNPLAAQRWVLHRQGLSSSVCQTVAGATQPSMSKVYQQCWKEWAGWDVEHLLSLLESWALASSLTTFKLAWKTATVLALVTVKRCSDLILLCIDNQHLFLQHHAAIFNPISGDKTD